MIFLDARGGICNRLRAIDSVYCLAKRIGQPLYVWCPRNVFMTCLFEELFLPIPGIRFIHTPLEVSTIHLIKRIQSWFSPNTPQAQYLQKRYVFTHWFFRKIYYTLCKCFRILYKYHPYPWVQALARHLHLRGPFYSLHIDEDTTIHPEYTVHSAYELDRRFRHPRYRLLPDPLPLKASLCTAQHLSIGTCQRLYQLASPNGSYFVPVPKLQRRIAERIQDFDEHVVGVHIRRTDSRPSIRYSPTTAFEKAMQEEINTNPNTRFYLATDDAGLRRYFKKRFPKRMIVSDGELKRDSITGMQEAIIELYALANTRKIIGSHVSSFSFEAAWLKGIPLQIARE